MGGYEKKEVFSVELEIDRRAVSDGGGTGGSQPGLCRIHAGRGHTVAGGRVSFDRAIGGGEMACLELVENKGSSINSCG